VRRAACNPISASVAGAGELVPLGEITPEHYDRTFDVNVKGALFTV